MSFSKAKIQRFNEVGSEAPPPGAYDPKFVNSKVVVPVLEKGERFHGKNGTECSSTVSSRSGAGSPIPAFRTPQVVRKRVIVKPANLTCSRKTTPKERQKSLGKTIQGQQKNINKMKEEINIRLQEVHKELEESKERYNEALAKYQKDVEDLQKHHEEEKAELQRLYSEAKEEYEKELENLTAARNKQLEEVRQACARKIEEETKRTREKATKMVANAEAVTRETIAACRAESEERVKKALSKTDTKMNAVVREAKSAVEEEIRLTNERYQACLARVEAERALLDEKLAQRNAEIAKLLTTVDELRTSAETQESFSQSLQVELDKAETELAEKKEELRALKDQIRAEAAEMVTRRKRFDVVMAENQASVAALTRRLVQSTAEVEKLQHELKRGEDCIHQHRDLLSAMRNNSQLVHEQVQVLMEQLNAKREKVDQLEAGSLNEIESVRAIFEAKIEQLNQVAAKEITRLNEECEKANGFNGEMKQQLGEMAAKLAEAESLLVLLEEKSDAQLIEISRLELRNEKLLVQLKNERNAARDSEDLRKAEASEHKIALDNANSRIEELSAEIKSLKEKEQQANRASFDEERAKWRSTETSLVQKLSAARAGREAAEERARKLTECNERLQKDLDEVSAKYAQLVGHQNPRQKIKHVNQLKEKINKLEQELHDKSAQVKQQQKTIEKMRAERSVGKENFPGLSKSAYATPTSSPLKPHTPLRDRNE